MARCLPQGIRSCVFACISLSLNSHELSTLTLGGHILNFLLTELSTLSLGGLSLRFFLPELKLGHSADAVLVTNTDRRVLLIGVGVTNRRVVPNAGFVAFVVPFGQP